MFSLSIVTGKFDRIFCGKMSVSATRFPWFPTVGNRFWRRNFVILPFARHRQKIQKQCVFTQYLTSSSKLRKYNLTSILYQDKARFWDKIAQKVIFNKLFAEISSILTHTRFCNIFVNEPSDFYLDTRNGLCYNLTDSIRLSTACAFTNYVFSDERRSFFE